MIVWYEAQSTLKINGLKVQMVAEVSSHNGDKKDSRYLVKEAIREWLEETVLEEHVKESLKTVKTRLIEIRKEE